MVTHVGRGVFRGSAIGNHQNCLKCSLTRRKMVLASFNLAHPVEIKAWEVSICNLGIITETPTIPAVLPKYSPPLPD